ncbi:MAG: exopolysaccharide transport family protein [Pseudomonadota bacterium]
MTNADVQMGEDGGAPRGGPFNPVLWLVETLWQYKWLIASIVLVGLVLSTALALRLPDIYRATGLLEIDPNRASVLPEERDNRFIPPETITETEVQVIRSARVLQEVVETLNLEFSAANPALREVSTRGTTDRRQAQTAIVGELADTLDVSPTGRSFVVEVAFESQDPAFAANVVNTVMAEYLGVEVSAARDLSREAVELLSRRITELRTTLDERERAVEDFRTQSRIAEGAGTNILSEQLARLNEELIRAQAGLAQAAASASSSERATDIASLPEVINSELIRSLREQEAVQARTVDELQTLYRSTHPRLIQARSALAAVRGAIETESEKIAASLSTSEEVQEQRVLALQVEVDALRDNLNRQRNSEIELRRLEREVDAARRVYEAFLNRLNEVQGTEGFERAEGQVIAAAVTPVTPSGPNRPLVVAGGGIVSSALAFMLVVGLALMDTRLRTAADVARASGLTPLATVPPMPFGRKGLLARLSGRSRNAAFAEAITQLRAALLIGPGASEELVVAFTAPSDGGEAGDQVSIATALAQAAAVAGDEVVLLDAAFNAPGVHALLGAPNEMGLSDILAEGGELAAIIQRDDASGLLFVSAGTNPDPALYRTPAMAALIDDFAQMFRTVIVALPPVQSTPEAQDLVSLCDVTAVVVRAGVTSREQLAELVALLRYSGYDGKLASVLLRG